MSKKVWTDEIIKYLKENYKNISNKELAEDINLKFGLNISISAVKTKKQKLGLHSSYKYTPKYTETVIKFILENYQGKSNIELANLLNDKFNLNVNGDRVGMFKANYKRRFGIDLRTGINPGCYKKGMIPKNKGKKWDEYMTKEQQEKARKTCFKKGNLPSNHVLIGTERISKDGCIEVKVRNGNLNKNWEYKHRLIYEENFGKIPKGYNVVFADGNKLNLEPNNLILVSNAELLIMNQNGFFKKDIELTKTGSNLAKLIDKTNKVIKNARK